jgi:hypothetical protein
MHYSSRRDSTIPPKEVLAHRAGIVKHPCRHLLINHLQSPKKHRPPSIFQPKLTKALSSSKNLILWTPKNHPQPLFAIVAERPHDGTADSFVCCIAGCQPACRGPPNRFQPSRMPRSSWGFCGRCASLAEFSITTKPGTDPFKLVPKTQLH